MEKRGGYSNSIKTSGAFYEDTSQKYWESWDGQGKEWNSLAFNAQRYNSIYGAATEVRPPNRNYLPIIKY